MLEEKIPVQILGQTYEIIGNAGEELYYHALARYVENKMKEAEESTNIVSTQKLAVLAALNIADELFRERENRSSSGSSVDKKHEELIRLLNKALDESSASLS